MRDRYRAHQLGSMFGGKWGITDTADDALFRHWRGPKSKKGRIWTGTEVEAEELAQLMNNGAVSQLGKVSIVGESFDPPKVENARAWAIANNKSRRAFTPSKVPFRKCDKCERMVKNDHEC